MADYGRHLPAPAAPAPLLGTRLLDQEMKHTEETNRTFPEGPQVDSRWGSQSCLGVLEGPLGVYLRDDCSRFLSLS